MNADKHEEFQLRLSNAGTVASARRIADTVRIGNQLKIVIYGFTWNYQMRFRKKLSIRLI